ncbi:transglutaminase-like cysteine peptidase [Neorhizobium sp. CSC1952]|uniref:Predicted transglutaminase-like cysteine proteinase n=1 Tax=Xaviernesmea oryzae TaxID=464029 RepID=A0A1X7GH35_9HYPH|nr:MULTISPECIES: transglutaminase-like cysteine peptidase [Rhizobium/Agrobacterium group]WJR66558.1 transglutaminase-like cysteine peptidase [Rhizobium sp. CSC1952]SMF69636.1 Predicted transglutaminase-like cysteine proteinase [Xaviernesmea oryzae]
MNCLKGLGLAAVTAVMAIFSAGQAFAMPPGAMRVIGQANPPLGHYEFCQTYVSECAATYKDAGPMTLTEDKWRTLLDVNYTVNSSITPMTDQEIYGVEERWAYPRTVGDCEDFVLLKRKMLMKKGFHPSDLLITVVLQPNGEGHAVLTVRSDRGDFVLDNMRNKVMLWSDTEYTYLKRQASDNPARWVKLQDGRATAVGSVGQ